MTNIRPFHVLTPLLKQVQSKGWTADLIKEIDHRLVMIRSIDVIQLLLPQGYLPSYMFIFNAARYGCLELLKFAKEHQFPFNEKYHECTCDKRFCLAARSLRKAVGR